MDVDVPVGLGWTCVGDWGRFGCCDVSCPTGMLFWV